MSATWVGRTNWSVNRDEDGHREYTLESKVVCTSVLDGPASVLTASGLPAVGTYWFFGGDVDVWAYCWPTASATPMVSDEPGYWWKVTQKFSTKPYKRCQSQSIEDPLLEPARISGSFNSSPYTTLKDRNGDLIESSSHESIAVEYDISDHIVVIEMNVASLDIAELVEYNNTLNDAELWGVAARKIRLVNPTWTRNVYGTCNYYFTVHYEFAIRDKTWDETEIADAGKRCIKGDWTEADPPVWTDSGLDGSDIGHFQVAKDPNGDIEGSKILLDGTGSRLTDLDNPVFLDPIELYDEKNFLLLGIPTDLELA